MMFKTHLAFGFLIGLISLKFLNISNPFVFLILITIFSSLPDIDHPKSKIGRKFPFLSWPINLIFKHRGFFHSIFPSFILFFVFHYFNLDIIAFPIALGYIAHLLGDSLTKEGINFLHPFSTFRIQGPIRTGGFLELIMLLFILITNLIYIVLNYLL